MTTPDQNPQPDNHDNDPSSITRRRFIAGSAAVAGIAVTGAALAACSSDPPASEPVSSTATAAASTVPSATEVAATEPATTSVTTTTTEAATTTTVARVPIGSLADIEHFVILMQENRSFDHYFGMRPGVRGYADPDPLLERQRVGRR